MDQYRSRLKLSENFERHWSIQISGEIHMVDQSLVHTFSWGNSYGPMVLKVLLKFPPYTDTGPWMDLPSHKAKCAEFVAFYRILSKLVGIMRGRPTQKTTHPNKNSLHKQFAQTISGKFVQTVPLLNKQKTDKRVCANCLCKLFLFGWVVFGGGSPSLDGTSSCTPLCATSAKALGAQAGKLEPCRNVVGSCRVVRGHLFWGSFWGGPFLNCTY